MEYLLVMALSGTTMTVMYLLLRRLLKKKLCAKAYYFLAKVAVLYYLIPLPFLKSWYRDMVPTAVLERRMGLDRISLTWTNVAVHAHGNLHVNSYAVIQTALAVVWFLGACVRLAKRLVRYREVVRWYSGYAKKTMTEKERSFAESLRKNYGVRRRVSFIQARNGDPTFTFGVLRPVIICGKEAGSREAEFLAGHEMVHIRRLDVFWKILMEAAALLHWWNPFMKKLGEDFDIVCECSCDEVTLRNRTEDEGKAYMRLMVEEARNGERDKEQDKKQNKEPEGPEVSWKAGFGSHTNEIRERVENLAMKKKWNRLATGALVAALILGNSMTVFAYRDGYSETLPEDVTQEEVEFVLDNDFAVFAPGGTDWEAMQNGEMEEEIHLFYEKQFTDEEGNVYPVFDEEGVEPYCNHSYVSGELGEHHPYSNGSCEMRVYNAERCVRCGHIIRHDLISSYFYTVCPH